MYRNGEESPIDIYPKLDRFEELVCKRFLMISQMRSGEGLITASDYLASFKLLNMWKNVHILLPIFIKVDKETTKFNQANKKRLQEKEVAKKKIKK